MKTRTILCHFLLAIKCADPDLYKRIKVAQKTSFAGFASSYDANMEGEVLGTLTRDQRDLFGIGRFLDRSAPTELLDLTSVGANPGTVRTVGTESLIAFCELASICFWSTVLKRHGRRSTSKRAIFVLNDGTLFLAPRPKGSARAGYSVHMAACDLLTYFVRQHVVLQKCGQLLT